MTDQNFDIFPHQDKYRYKTNIGDTTQTIPEENLTIVSEESASAFARLDELREKSRLYKLKFKDN